MPISALEPVTQTNVDLLSSGEPCSFLSQPKSANWWPVYAYQDTHKECLKFNQVRNCEERSDELGMRKYRSLSTYPTSFSLDIDTIITAT